MTDDEIIKAAAAIKTRREAAARGRAIFGAHTIEIVVWDKGARESEYSDRLPINASPELAALLCKELGVSLSEGNT